jgi:hypothetical protein
MTRAAAFQLKEAIKFLDKIETSQRRQGRRGVMKADSAKQHAENLRYLLASEYTTVAPMYDEAAA